MSNMPRLREATIDDSCVIASLIRQAFHRQVEILQIQRSEYPNYVGFDSAARVRDRFRQGYRMLLVYFNDRPVGTVAFRAVQNDRSRGEITRLAVLPKFRGADIGIILMNAAEEALCCADVTTVEISIVAQFGSLRAYYESMGYVSTVLRHFSTLPFEVQFLEKSITHQQ